MARFRKTRPYRDLMLACSCGRTFRSYAAEAYHRHNFPVFCKRAEPEKTPKKEKKDDQNPTS